MTYVQGRVVRDADSHVMETPDWLEPFADAKHVEDARLFRQTFGAVDKLLAAAKEARANVDAFSKATANPIAGPKGWSALGASDRHERNQALDRLGFSSQLVFPTAGLAPVHAAKDPDTRYAVSRAYNRAIAAFCADPRLIAVGHVPLDDAQRALEEAERAIDGGCGAIHILSGPAGQRSPGHPDYDPFWGYLSDRNIPFMLHIGKGTMTQPEAFHNNGRKRAPDLHGGGENLRFCDYIMLWYAPQVLLTALVYDGVFERFPRLRGGVIESGAGWVPDFLRQLDLAYQSFSKTDPYLRELTLMPSDYLRRAVKFTPFPRENVGLMIRDAGPDLFLFSSDYPHPEGTTDPLWRFERSMEGLDESAKDKFYRANFEQMMGIAASPGVDKRAGAN
jgi:predicted TIM-barrel fold metal-dependent hydrolase